MKTTDELKIDALTIALEDSQRILALVANDPTDPENGNRAARQFDVNRAVLTAVEKNK